MMSDCDKCWETPCSCGYGYKDWSIERLKDFLDMIQTVIDDKEAN